MSTKPSTKAENSVTKQSPIDQAVAAWRAAKGADKVKLVNGLTDALVAAVGASKFEQASEIKASLDAIKVLRDTKQAPKVSKAQLLANQHAVLVAALATITGDSEYDKDLAPTLSEADIATKAAKVSTVRSVTRGAKGDRQGWVLTACAALGDGQHTVNDLITKSGIKYPGSNTQPNGAVGDWHTTHEGETFDIEGGTMTVGFDSGHGDTEKGHRVFIVTMD